MGGFLDPESEDAVNDLCQLTPAGGRSSSARDSAVADLSPPHSLDGPVSTTMTDALTALYQGSDSLNSVS